MYLNGFFRKVLFITGACIMATIGLNLSACGDSDSLDNPVNPSQGNQQGKTLESFPISVNQSKHELTMNFHFDNEGCILQDEKLGWDTKRFYFETVFLYSIENGILTLNNEDVHFSPLWGPENKSIFGEWSPLRGDETINEYVKYVITRDSLLIKEGEPYLEIEEPPSEPVETPITLRTSYFMFDLYRCITEEHFCVFNQWHFSKLQGPNANSMASQYKITILEETSNSMRIISNDREIFINVLHVQDDSLNNGNGYYSAYIAHQQDTCFYEFFKGPVTKDLCKEENLPYFQGYVVGEDYDDDEDDDEDDEYDEDYESDEIETRSASENENKDHADQEVYAVLNYMVKSNGNEFARCVDKMLNKR